MTKSILFWLPMVNAFNIFPTLMHLRGGGDWRGGESSTTPTHSISQVLLSGFF